MLLGDTPDSRKSFRSAQRAVTKAVHKAQEDWIENVAKKAEAAGRDGCVQWKCVGQLGALRSGRKPATASALRDANGDFVTSPDGLKSCWHTHFSKVLDIPSIFNPHVIEDLPAAEPRHGFDDSLNMEELMTAVRSLNCGTARGSPVLSLK